MATFQELTAQYLSGLGISIQPDEIPDEQTAHAAIQFIADWSNTVDDRTWMVIKMAGGEVADGMWHAGLLEHWQGLYNVLKENPSGTMKDTLENVRTCIIHASQELPNQGGGLAGDGTGVDSIPNAAGDEGSESDSEQNQ